MELPRTPPSCSQSHRTSQDARHSRDPECHLLRRSRRLPLEAVAQRLPSLEECLPLLPLLAPGRDVGEDALSPAREGSSPSEEEPSAQRSHSGQPVGQNDRGGRKGARLRRSQEGQRKKAPSSGGHAGVGARSEGPQRQNPRPEEGIKLLLEASSPHRLPRLSHVWLDAGYTGEDKGAGWVQSVLGWTAEIVRHPKKLAPEEVMRAWVREFNKEGVPIDLDKLLPGKGPRPFLPKRWIVERTFSWLAQNRRMSLGTTRGCRRAQKPSFTWR